MKIRSYARGTIDVGDDGTLRYLVLVMKFTNMVLSKEKFFLKWGKMSRP